MGIWIYGYKNIWMYIIYLVWKYTMALKYPRGCKYSIGLIYGYICIRCMDVWIYEYMDNIDGYLDIWIYEDIDNSGLSCISGESIISTILSISWVSHIWIFLLSILYSGV